jgi:hypothetical protein
MFARYAMIGLMAILGLHPILFGSDDAAPQVAMVRVEIDQDMLTLDVGPDGNGTALITGRIYLTYPNNPLMDSVDVVIEADYPDYAGLVLSAYDFTLSASEPEVRIWGNLTAPPSTSSSLGGNVMIDGSAVVHPSGSPAQLQADIVGIEILPYYGAALYFQEVFGKMGSDTSMTFILQLNNTGNAMDTYTIALIDGSILRTERIIVDFEGTQTVPEGGSAQVKMNVRVKGAERGTYMIKVQATSQGKGTGEPEVSVAMLTLTVEKDVITFLQGNPYTILGALAMVILLIAAISIGASMYLKRRRWKRQFQRMLDSAATEGREVTPPGP